MPAGTERCDVSQAGAQRPRLVRFGEFELDPRTGELRKDDARVTLQEQPLKVLQGLLEHPGDLVTREDLRQRLWPGDTFVDFEHGVNAAVKRLREALGDSADTPLHRDSAAPRVSVHCPRRAGTAHRRRRSRESQSQQRRRRQTCSCCRCAGDASEALVWTADSRGGRGHPRHGRLERLAALQSAHQPQSRLDVDSERQVKLAAESGPVSASPAPRGTKSTATKAEHPRGSGYNQPVDT